MFFGGCGFNILIHKYFSEEWEQIYQASPKNKTTEGNSAAIYFPYILHESISQSIFFIFYFSWFKKLIVIYARCIRQVHKRGIKEYNVSSLC